MIRLFSAILLNKITFLNSLGFYVLIVVILICLVIIYKLRSNVIKFKQLNIEKKQEIQQYEKKINQTAVTLYQLHKKQSELETKLIKKTHKLAVVAKDNIDMNRALNQVRAKVLLIENNLTQKPFVKTRVAETRRILNAYCNQHNDTFEMQIDEIHLNFFKNMKEIYPDLTNYDLRLCAYLKMGMNTKEIAEIVNVLPSSINVSRSRLRKKLNLDPSEDLFKYLCKLEDNAHHYKQKSSLSL